MKPHDKGTIGNSQIYFYSPSMVARDLYFYPIYLGHYYCNQEYLVNRNHFNNYLFIYVKSGNGYVEIDEQRLSVSEGSIILIDCYKQHKYYTNSNWEIYWMHFEGVMAQKFYDFATLRGNVISPANHYAITHGLRKLVLMFEEKVQTNEALFSKCIHDLLIEFIISTNKNECGYLQPAVIDEAIKFISENVEKDITLELLAKQAALSPFYFSRLFKRETGFTPHKYIIMIRIDYSRYLLRTSNMAIKEIAYRSGFSSESSFCTCFRKVIGSTPNHYRNSD